MLYWKWNMTVFGRMPCLIHETQADMLDNKDTAFCWDVVTTSNQKTWEALIISGSLSCKRKKKLNPFAYSRWVPWKKECCHAKLWMYTHSIQNPDDHISHKMLWDTFKDRSPANDLPVQYSTEQWQIVSDKRSYNDQDLTVTQNSKVLSHTPKL